MPKEPTAWECFMGAITGQSIARVRWRAAVIEYCAKRCLSHQHISAVLVRTSSNK